jgi:hypothetical protein
MEHSQIPKLGDSKINRTPRTEETRVATAQRRPWARPSRLDAPQAPEGFKYRWIRASVNGFEDKQHVYGKIREGYELVRIEELPESERDHTPTMDDGRYKGVVSVGGLMLAKIPLETVEERNAYYRNKAREQLQAVDNDMMRENSHSSMRINRPERDSRVTFNGPRGNGG